MSVLLPENLCRLQATCFVQDAELQVVGRSGIIRHAAEKLCRQALEKLLTDCVKSEGSYMGFSGSTLMLDVYVLSPTELHQALAQAVEIGRRDASRWFLSPNYE